MSRLTSLIRVIPPENQDPTPEDIFASAPGNLFTDDLRVQHGDAGDRIIYHNSRFGQIELTTAEPQGEQERTLFSHYLWNAGIQMAELISGSDEHGDWSVKGERVVELGAGVGLAGIVAALSGSSEAIFSDYPSPTVLANLKQNVDKNLASRTDSIAKYSIQGHEWGELSDELASSHSHYFTRVIAADCLWMPGEHDNLVRSMLHFLSFETDATVFVTAGFHTGRAKLAAFFDAAEVQGLIAEDIYEEDANGVRRDWAKERDRGREDHAERNRWLVVARLRRRTQGGD